MVHSISTIDNIVTQNYLSQDKLPKIKEVLYSTSTFLTVGKILHFSTYSFVTLFF